MQTACEHSMPVNTMGIRATYDLQFYTPDSDGAVLMRDVRHSPVVVHGESPCSVTKVVISAPLGLHTLGCTQT